MSKDVIFDVDNTILDIGTPWLRWLERVTNTKVSSPPNQKLPYDLTELFKEELDRRGIDGHVWFKRPDLYDNLHPYTKAVEVIDKLHSEGYRIIFASHVEGSHAKSKYEMLKRNFPYMAGFLATREKDLVRGDVIVDDRLEHLLNQPEGVRRILFNTNYRQNLPLDSTVTVAFNFSEVYTNIKLP